jgi:electron transfer flavoprotein alpha subunit
MNYKVILNGCSSSFSNQCSTVGTFLTSTAVLDRKAQTIIFYNNPALTSQLAAEAPTDRVHLIKIYQYEADTVLAILTELEKPDPAELYLFPGDYAGSELAVRLACRLTGSSLAAVDSLQTDQDQIICTKAVYNGYLQGRFNLKIRPYCLSLARGISGNRNKQVIEKQEIIQSDRSAEEQPAYIIKRTLEAIAPVSELEEAKFVVAGGRGIKSKGNYLKLQQSARRLGAALGVSRPVAMNGWAPLDKLVGASGAMISPEICLALAVSGSPAFFSGIEKSRRIIAFNTDPHATIVKNADLAVIDDYKEVLDELTRLIENENTR